MALHVISHELPEAARQAAINAVTGENRLASLSFLGEGSSRYYQPKFYEHMRKKYEKTNPQLARYFTILLEIGEDMHYLQEDYELDPIGKEHIAQQIIFKEKEMAKIFKKIDIDGESYESYMARMPDYGSVNPGIPREYIRTPEGTPETPKEMILEKQLVKFMDEFKTRLSDLNTNPNSEEAKTGLRNAVFGIIRIHEMEIEGTALKTDAKNCIMEIADLLGVKQWQEMYLWDVWLLFMYIIPG